jgi:TDG/mug DNA glycosylase family protein
MTRSVGFPPVSASDARVLILGSLPGGESLRRQQYYAKPGNSFWWIMGHLAGAAPELPYEERLRRLTGHGIALWDVCASATRPGSLDSSIVPASVVANDFAGFLKAHPRIVRIGLNGAAAAKMYARLVLPGLAAQQAALLRVVLPSTSPAHAARRPAQKLEIWREMLEL